MKLDLKPYLAKLKPVLAFLRRYMVAITIVLIVGVFGFLVWRIGTLANADPNGAALDEALTTVKRPRIDPNAIQSLQDLQSQNINLESLFPTDRNNPFQE